MFIFSILTACGGKQTEPESPAVEEPAVEAPVADQESVYIGCSRDSVAL